MAEEFDHNSFLTNFILYSERKSTTGSQYSFKLTAVSNSSPAAKIEERYETFADLEDEKSIPFVSIQLHKVFN